jgi:hypothetical protein
MKAISFLILFILMCTGAWCQDAEGFVLVKSDPPYEVLERWVEFPGKQPPVTSRELKAEFIVNASARKIIDLLKDESRVRLWQAHLRDYKIYSKADTATWDEYSCHDVPWPLNDQDSFMEYKLTEVSANKEYLIDFRSRIDKKIAPVQESIHRIELNGSWRLIQVTPDVVRVTYRIQSVPATDLPRMIIDPVVRNSILNTVRSLTEIAEK